MQGKKFWRCNVCNDVHCGIAGPETCPTCGAKDAYCEMDAKEAANMLDMKAEDTAQVLQGEDLRNAWQKFAEKNDFMLNPDKEHVDMIIKGVAQNQDKFGLKLCPCRMRDGSRQRDLELVCPCNFRTHDTWNDEKKQHCWCGLFVKRR
jgi:ferredoxin-thioredoxin reductase catalytic subunit